MLRELTYDTAVITINYAVHSGDGPPVVLFHGFMGRWQDFLPILPALTEHRSVFAPDMRGHGGSSRAPDGVYRHEDIVDDSLAFLRDIVGESAILVGHSAGVPAAVEACVRRPDLVRGVVVGDFPIDVPFLADVVRSEQSVAHHRAVRELAGRQVEEILPVLPRLYPEAGPREHPAMAESLHLLDPHAVDLHAEGRIGDLYGDLDGDALLGEVPCPVLLLQGDPRCGGLMPDEWARHALSLLEDARHTLLEGIGHELGLTTGRIEPLLAALLPFLQSS